MQQPARARRAELRAGDFKIEGSIAGSPKAIVEGWTSATIDQTGSPATLDVKAGSSDSVHLEWHGLVSIGQIFGATGTVVVGGTTICAGNGSQLQLQDAGAAFRLTNFTQGPCPGAAPLAGDLAGCYGGH